MTMDVLKATQSARRRLNAMSCHTVAARGAAGSPLPRRTTSIAISCRNINVRFFTDRRSVTAIEGLSLDVAAGEFLTLLGPSGCGKSTFLRVVADLSRRAAARSACSARRPRMARERRDIGFVFQDAALCPGAPRCRTSQLPLKVGRPGARRPCHAA